ncbi:MAG: 5-(carboxyamino)imidazole ribonucleotide mutase [Myxococcota bacterium]|jgi:5-(carboxyamino)imidazole ribonucleotide mutase|nr:5-(carboxyamino)imidazole ribonucleotide mutase [Myxococcota bacterium]
MTRKHVLIVMGSENDFLKVEPAVKILRDLDVDVRVTVASAHRSPQRAAQVARSARGDGAGAIIAAAGGAAHLAGAMAANTTLPVIALPICVGTLGGLDALLSAVQMPGGVPIASVGVDGAKNAALLCAAILGAYEEPVATRLEQQRADQAKAVEKSDCRVQEQLSKNG